jgi:hypothetical protein
MLDTKRAVPRDFVGESLGGAEKSEPARQHNLNWPEPKPLPSGLMPVQAFDLELLPKAIAPWVADIAERMQCPLDFVGIPATVALGSVLGRRIGVRPQRRTDWFETPTYGAASSDDRG